MDTFIGSILLVPYNFTPNRWSPCNGQLMSIRENTALFSLLGTTFGGDGISTFALPKLEGPAEGTHYIIALEGIYPPRS
jgi:microcystin-dependent protein